MKKSLKVLSIALTVALIIGIFSCATPVFAAEVTEKDTLNSTLEQYKTEIENLQSKTMYEIEEERDKYTKVFKNNDGTKTAIVSATPIHYETDEGWEDIENTLVEEKSVTGEVYKNKKNDFTVTIPKEMSENKELKIEKDNYSVSFKLEGSDIFLADKKVKGNKKNKPKKSIENPGEINTDFLDKTAEVVFENIGENTSVEYEVTSTGLKENIVLNKKPANEVAYKYKIKAKDLIGKLNKDSSVTFNSSDGEEIFEIPAPIMFDVENVVSKDIEVSLTGKNGKYTLIYKPSYEWLSGDVTYPVVIDPVINTSDEFWRVKDTISDSAHANNNYGDYPVLHTYKSDTGNLQSFIDISKDILKSGVKIKSVLLGLYYEKGVFRDDNTTVAAYTITSDWDESTLTYNNRPTTINSLIDRIDINRDTQASYLLFDVTEAYTLKEKTYGVCIRQRDSVTNEAMLYFSSSECSTTSQNPFYIIEYYETLGVEEQFDYHSFDVGRAGTAYFNDFTEQVYIERDELGLSGINMPVQIKRYYNSNYGGTNSGIYSVYANYASFYGFGWMTNYDQFIEYKSNIDENETILYHNSEGKIIYFEKGEANSEGKTVWNEKTDNFSNSDGYTLYIPTQYEDNIDSNYEHIKIKDSSGQIYEFDSSGFLSKINSAEENSTKAITIAYNDDGIISKVTDGVGREYRFSYTEYEEWLFPLLTSIQAFSPSGSAITVTNDSGAKVPYKMTYNYTFADYMGTPDVPQLSSVTYPDGETVYYTIRDNFISLKNIDGYAIEFAFNQSNTVISEKAYSENGTDFTSGGQLTITDENSYEKSYVDLNGTKITKQFDMYGRTINTKNNGDITQSVARTYSDDYKAQGSVSYSFYNTYEQDFVGEETNLVTNGSFTNNLNDWDVSNSSIVTHDTTEDCVANNGTRGSLKIKGKQSSRRYAYQVIDIENGVAGDEYRLDYFKNNDDYAHLLVDLGYLSTVIIQARNSNDNGEWQEVALVEENPLNPNWQKYSYSFDIDFEYDELKIILVHYYQYGSVYFDDVSLVNTYKAPVNQPTGAETENGNTGSGTTPSEPENECICNGCPTSDCPCTENCSDNCTLPYCNRGYNFKNDSVGISFSITDGEKTMAMKQTINGNFYGGQSDLNGIYTGYSYNPMNSQLESVYDSEGYVTNFSYDAMSRLNKVSKEVNNKTMETSYSYNNDRIESITHNDFSYNYEYDVWGNPTAVKVGEQPLVSYRYDSENETRDRVNRITYGNGDYTVYEYDNDTGNIETIKTYSAENVLVSDYLYSYDENGQIEKITNNIEDTEIKYIDGGYDFVKLNGEGEEDDCVIYSKNIEDDGKTVEILAGKEYNETNRTTHSDAVSGTTTVKSDVTTPQGNYSVASATDYFGRVKYKDTILATEVGNGYTGSEKFRVSYEYADGNDDKIPNRTTGLVSKYTITHGTYVETVDKQINPNLSTGFYEIYSIKEYLYDYDDNGNITRIRLRTVDDDGDESITELSSYVYDCANQLVRENNAELNKTFVYVYDKGGNIAQKKEYAYSTGNLGEVISIINYSYDSVWKDKLTAYGATQIQTDAMGNPLNYTGVSINDTVVNGTLEWNGRQLAAANVGNERFEYSYDANGLRTSVKYYASNEELARTYYYIWQNGKLVGYYVEEASGNNGTSIKLLFDEKGEPIGYMSIETGGDGTVEYFLFRKNLQGDITAVCEQNGNEIITYSYDAWGKVVCTPQSGDLAAILSALLCTPITYRGYNYDIFTGLYYLQSRYYNPTYGRFLNADSIMKTGEPLGANIFAYCGNNPVNFVDYDGRDESQISTVIRNIIITIIAVLVLDKKLNELGLSHIFNNCKVTGTNVVSTYGGVLNFYISLSQGNTTHMFEYLITFSLGTKMQWYDYANKIESIGIMGVWQPALSILIGGLTAAFTTTWIGFGISAATTIFLSAHNDKVNTYKTMILETILNGNESDLYFELSSIILITTPLFGESENKELLNSIIFEKVEGLV